MNMGFTQGVSKIDYQAIIRPHMRDKRYNHSIAVAVQAVHLAKIWGADEEKAHIAGTLHDICKEWSRDDMLKLIEKHGIILDKITKGEQGLWHSAVGSAYIRELGITDDEILSAVRYHTSAKSKMTLLEKIIYLADLTSADRDYPDIDYMRGLCESSLDKAMYEALKYIVGDLVQGNMAIVKDTWQAYNYYLGKQIKNGGQI